MKASLTFNLPDERYEYEIHTQAVDMYHAIGEILQKLRSAYKHLDEGSKISQTFEREDWEYMTDRNDKPVDHDTTFGDLDALDGLQLVRGLLYRNFRDENVNLDIN